jgi:hypothetical protein
MEALPLAKPPWQRSQQHYFQGWFSGLECLTPSHQTEDHNFLLIFGTHCRVLLQIKHQPTTVYHPKIKDQWDGEEPHHCLNDTPRAGCTNATCGLASCPGSCRVSGQLRGRTTSPLNDTPSVAKS